MATKKITVTLQDDQIEEIRALVGAGAASNMSAFVQHAVRIALHDAAGWAELLQDAMEQTGGPLTRKERALADATLGRHIPKSSQTGARFQIASPSHHRLGSTRRAKRDGRRIVVSANGNG